MKPKDFSISYLLSCMRQLEAGVVETLSSGNISIRLPDGTIAIKPSGLSYAQCVTDLDVSVISSDGTHLSGPAPSSDTVAHLSLYTARPDVYCIVHTHSHYATVMSVLNQPLHIYSTLHADYFGKEIHCAPYVNHRTDNFGVAAAKSKEDVMLMANHGALILGIDPEKVIRKTIALEEVARINFHIHLLKKDIPELNPHDIQALNNYYQDGYGQQLESS